MDTPAGSFEMHDLQALFRDTLIGGLQRKSITSCSRWAEKYRVMGRPFPGPWTHTYHPWLRDMQDSTAQENVGQKSAQVGFTEAVLNRTFFNMDILGIDCLYVLPSKTPDASDFSASRFDGALELSDHLGNLFSDVKNVGHKRAGAVNLYLRGSNSRGGLKSIPVGFIAFDELDEMNQDNVVLAVERTSGQQERQLWYLSTATVPNFGINARFQLSTQEHFCFPCPHCGKSIELTWPDNIVITADSRFDPKITDSHFICNLCKRRLEHSQKHVFLQGGRWNSTTENISPIRGFYINQMYSSALAGSAPQLAIAYLDAQVDKAAEQEFFNSKLGLPHIVEGAQVTDIQFDKCIGGHAKGAENKIKFRTMGIDVGRWLHYEIDAWECPKLGPDLNLSSRPTVLMEGKVASFEDLGHLMREYQILFSIIDAHPERRKAYEFACNFWGHVKLCFYGRGLSGRMVNVSAQEESHSVTVDRTSWLDMSLSRFHAKTIVLPRDVSNEYRQHIKNLARVYDKDADGNPIGKYVNMGDDHFGHARTYAEIALPFAASMSTNQTIRSFL